MNTESYISRKPKSSFLPSGKILFMVPLMLLLSFKAKEKRQTVEINTDYGLIKVMLYNETPQHRDNILKLAKEHFYDSLLFHRVIKSFMIQGGDPESKHAPAGKMLGAGDVGYTIPAELRADLFHKKGVIAAARDNNPEKRSSGCQFYIVVGKPVTDADLDNVERQTGIKYTAEQRNTYKTLGGTPRLDQNYTVYGEVYEGLNVVDSIIHVQTDGNDRPVKDVHIISMKPGKKMKVNL